jgi:hypothetical protein
VSALAAIVADLQQAGDWTTASHFTAAYALRRRVASTAFFAADEHREEALTAWVGPRTETNSGLGRAQ